MNIFSTLVALLSLTLKKNFFVHIDVIPNASDLVSVEYLKQYRKFRFFNSENSFFFQVDYIATMSV